MFCLLTKPVKQEEFESLKEAASAALGDAHCKTHDTQHPATVDPTTTAFSTKIPILTPFSNKTSKDSVAEVQSDFKYLA